ncbi:30S ribosomal protein S16 [Candidatus Aerophobetes bacterium]|uniref:Small ribosomal subunit protein bS16 n=1 Tax=Aerophobetes bacterium TaxID=2030807 RepID=A0A662D643_UNCAE|nr:MAG: 30S ribosomal protein S16 [Candidatus Aerophobetes bacterium]
MATRIRLRRMGAKKVPFYRIVVANSRSPVKGKFIEILGWYDPRGKKVEVNKGKVLDWVSKGAQLSNSVKKLLLNFSIFSSKEIP